ncbi:hypothetical protein SAMN04487995_3088 [Dyadobacter koreensis]|uniref:Uncharacterized protein n=1 Tax=Dyadobacter koreensis TaxID=408657 RepID=A0A1H6VD64_9BACT|nr:hypothetical protein [Dyadobacter koreensis]SEJ02511.1 hypothetical protein SAMN04487995_3088 [Dyadobacter koreensis]
MIYEKIFRHAVGREAKVIIKGEKARYSNNIVVELEFLVKDTHDLNFHQPIGKNHPQYWKLKKSTPERAYYLQLEYSGVSRKEILETVKEFKLTIGSQFTFRYKTPLTERIKYLKGIRVNAASRKILMAGA